MVYQVSQIHASAKYNRTANEYISPTYLIQFVCMCITLQVLVTLTVILNYTFNIINTEKYIKKHHCCPSDKNAMSSDKT